MAERPLDGVVVVDMGQVLATPFATYLLHLLGAEVVKIEPPAGEWMRGGNPRGFATQNAGKQSVTVDLRSPGGSEVVRRLIEAADVFVEGFAPGTAESMGLGWDDARKRNPTIVYGSLSAFGSSGPYAGRPGFDHVVQAVSGTMMSSGFPGGPPIKVGAPYLDYGGGLLLAFGLLAGILERRRTGRAVRVDATMLDAGLLMNAAALVNTQATGVDPPRTGNNAFSGAVASGAFETSDGWLMLAANKASHLTKLEALLGVDPLPTDDVDRARAVLGGIFATDTATRWETRLNAAGVPAARVRSLSEVTGEGYPIERGLLSPVDVPGADEPLYLPGAGIRLDGTMPAPTAPPPAVGQHTGTVLARFGFSDEEIGRLAADGAITLPER
ncbi:MAG: CaiB/BaiF CoA transferase family protein [Acidimicrobiales bacterium]